MNFITKYNITDNKEFRKTLIENLPGRMFDLILYRLDKQGEALTLTDLDYFPIQFNTCTLIGNSNAIGIGFEKRQFLLRCVGKKRIQGLNGTKKKIENQLDKIESVLGKVSAVEELRKDIKNMMLAIDNIFDYDK